MIGFLAQRVYLDVSGYHILSARSHDVMCHMDSKRARNFTSMQDLGWL